MSLLQSIPPAEFSGFGPSLLASPTRGRIQENNVPDDRMDARSMLHDRCPLTPGVYGWLDANDQICYVGKSKSLRKRLLTYFSKTPSDPKAHRIRQHSQRLVWEPMSDELLALIREQELIYRWRPDFNTQGQPVRRQPAFVCFSSGPAPKAMFARRIPAKTIQVFGPIAGTSRLRAAVESLNQVFQLRDCPDKTKFEFADQQQLFANPTTAKCIRYELGTCPAPCAARCTADGYREHVTRALRFLKGTDLSIIDRLEQSMVNASADCQFEKAAVLRDHLDNLQWLRRRLNDLEKSKRNLNGILPTTTHSGKTVWLMLRAGRLIGSAPRPTSTRRAAKAIETLSEIASTPDHKPVDILEMNLQLILASWFRRYPAHKKQLIDFDQAIDWCTNFR